MHRRPDKTISDFIIASRLTMTFGRDLPLVKTFEGLGSWRIAGILFVFIWFFLGGIAHFVFTDIEMRIVPPYIPWPRAAVLISGVFELLGAWGLLRKSSRRAAGLGLCLLTLAVTPCHIYMLQRPELFSIPYWVLIARLPVQAALLALIAWSTAPSKAQYRR